MVSFIFTKHKFQVTFFSNNLKSNLTIWTQENEQLMIFLMETEY